MSLPLPALPAVARPTFASLSSLPDELLQHVFRHLLDMPSNEYHESRAIRPFPLELCLLNKRIFDIAYPIHTSRLYVPASAYEHDAVLHGLLTTSGAGAYVRELELSLKSETARLASHILGDCRNVTSFSILSGDPHEPTDLPAELISTLRAMPHLQSLTLDADFFHPDWDQFRLDAAVPTLRELDISSLDLLIVLAPGLASVRSVTLRTHTVGSSAAFPILRASVRRLFIVPTNVPDTVLWYQGEIDFVHDLGALILDSDAPLALEHVSLRLSGGEYAASSTAAYIGYRDLRSLLEIFSNASIKSLELSDMHARSCAGLLCAAHLPNTSSLSIEGRYSLVEPAEQDAFLSFLRQFPALTTLHLRVLLPPFQSRGPVALVTAAANSAELVQLHRKGIGMSSVVAWTVECDGRKVRMWRETGGTLEWTWSHAEYGLAE